MQYLNNKFNFTTETKIFCHIFVCSSGMILDLRGTRQILETWEWYEFPLTNYGDRILHLWMGTYFISFKIKKNDSNFMHLHHTCRSKLRYDLLKHDHISCSMFIPFTLNVWYLWIFNQWSLKLILQRMEENCVFWLYLFVIENRAVDSDCWAQTGLNQFKLFSLISKFWLIWQNIFWLL